MEFRPNLEPVDLRSCEPGTWLLGQNAGKPRLLVVQEQPKDHATAVIEFDHVGSNAGVPSYYVENTLHSRHNEYTKFTSSMRIDFIEVGSYGPLPEAAESLGKIALTENGPQIVVANSRWQDQFHAFNLRTNGLDDGGVYGLHAIVTRWRLCAVEDDGKVSWSRDFDFGAKKAPH